MMLNEEEDLKFLDTFFKTKNFLYFFSLKWPAYFFLWLYTIFFGFFVKHIASDLFEAGFNLSVIASYLGLKWILSCICFKLCLASLSYQRALRGSFGCIYFFTLVCLLRFSWKVCNTSEKRIVKIPEMYMEELHDFFEAVENRWMKYFCYIVHTFTVTLGWHITRVIYSHHRESWIGIIPALEGNVADLHIESRAIKPTSTSVSNQQKKRSNKKCKRRR